jgi:hypothetical protein
MISSCARFKVDKLNSEIIFKIPASGPGKLLNYPFHRGLMHEIPSHVGVVDNWLVISEPSNKAIKIFNGNKLTTVILASDADGAPYEEMKKKNADLNFNVIMNVNVVYPGTVVAGRNDDFYVVTYKPSAIEQNTNPNVDSQSTGYYKILHFDVKGNFINVIGRELKQELPFESIIWLDTDDNNDLWVLYRHFNELHLDNYGKDGMLASIDEKDCSASMNPSEVTDKDHLFTCEVLYPFDNGKKVLMSGRFEKLENEQNKENTKYLFIERLYASKTLKTGQVETIFHRKNDPDSYPYLSYGDNFFMWKTISAKRTKLSIYTTSGELENNLQIDLYGQRNDWRSTYATLSGKIYSLRIFDKNLEVHRWR